MQEITYQVSYLSWGVKYPLLPDIFLEGNHSLYELMVDCIVSRKMFSQFSTCPTHTNEGCQSLHTPIFASPPHSSYSSEGDLILR